MRQYIISIIIDSLKYSIVLSLSSDILKVSPAIITPITTLNINPAS
jgi:hypothetical protein